MSRQDKVKREALKRKAESQARLSSVGLRPEDKLMAVGIVLERIGEGDLAKMVLDAVFRFSQAATGIDMAIFVQEMARPVAQVLCPLLDPHALSSWPEPLIATSPVTCLEALESRAPAIVHYVYDDNFLDPRGLSREEFRRTFNDRRVQVVIGKPVYGRPVEDAFGIQVYPTVVPKFELELIVPALLPAMRGIHAV